MSAFLAFALIPGVAYAEGVNSSSELLSVESLSGGDGSFESAVSKGDTPLLKDMGDQGIFLNSDEEANDSVNAPDKIVEETESLIELIYVASPELIHGESQEMAVLLSPDSILASMTLGFVDASGAVFEVESHSLIENSASFIFGETWSSGAYVLSYLQYSLTEEGAVHRISFDSASYSFEISNVKVSDFEAGDSYYYENQAGRVASSDDLGLALQESTEGSSSLFSLHGVDALNSASIIALDPGHGGADPGAIGNGLRESDLTWSIAMACKERLEGYGFTVVLTRNQYGDYQAGDFKYRVQRALDQGAQVFVSLHINSSSVSSAKGAEVYYPQIDGTVHTETSANLAQEIQDRLVALGLSDRGAKDMQIGDEFAVIRQAREAGIPGVLVEHGFISNYGDASAYFSEQGCRSLGYADADAIANQFFFASDSVSLSSESVQVGSEVSYSANTNSDSSGLTYSYAWSYEGGWDLWGSTLKDTGAMTSAPSGSFTPSRPGDYYVWVDVADASGRTLTTDRAKVSVSALDWSVSGVSAPSSGKVGSPVEFSASVSGPDSSGLTYSYAWSYEGGWDLWGSTLKDTGAMTSAPSGSFTPSRPGDYYVWVDVADASGRTLTTDRAKVSV
ncbi:N-acetylmuramoyl-L-alanine amidase, partial [uncultured Slackia sp.]|uniref:N-acetylmuramoyl-L-alanine amidase family protein n=1 Tax=uncultured Slackia sp. TaxID=665903 RepID=UPI00280A5D86